MMNLYLAKYTLGRMLLHLGCIARGGQWKFHWTGVLREFTRLRPRWTVADGQSTVYKWNGAEANIKLTYQLKQHVPSSVTDPDRPLLAQHTAQN